MNDRTEKLSGRTVVLHWVIAFAMIAMVVFGLVLEEMPRSDGKSALIQLHKSLGVVVLVLAMWRIVWRLRQGMPGALSVTTALQARIGHAVHGFLLLATVLLPVSGMIYSIGSARPISLFGLPFIPQLLTAKNDVLAAVGKGGHAILGKLVILFVLLHVAGALKHHFVERDGTLRRMLGARVEPGRDVA